MVWSIVMHDLSTLQWMVRSLNEEEEDLMRPLADKSSSLIVMSVFVRLQLNVMSWMWQSDKLSFFHSLWGEQVRKSVTHLTS